MTAHSEQHCVKNLRSRFLFRHLILYYHLQFVSLLVLTNKLWQRCLPDVNFPLFQIFHYIFDHIPIKRSEILPSCHQSHIISHTFQESSNFNSHIPSANDQCLSWGFFQAENIVAGNRELASLNLKIRRSSSCRNQKVFGSNLLVQWLILRILG